MILKKLFELANRENLLADAAFDEAPIACVVLLSDSGDYLGLRDLRFAETVPPKTKKGKPRQFRNKGKCYRVPIRSVMYDSRHQTNDHWKLTDPASSGKERPAAFLVDTLPRVLPIDKLIESERRGGAILQRRTFWRFIKHIASQLNSHALVAMSNFAEKFINTPQLAEKIVADVGAGDYEAGQLCTFALASAEGNLILEQSNIQQWWRDFCKQDDVATSASIRLCQVTGENLPLASSIKTRINGLVGIGCRADAYLVTSVDASESYGMEKSLSACVSEKAVDGFTRALNMLIADKRAHVQVGKTMFLFWTRVRQNIESFLSAIENADPDAVKSLLESPSKGKETLAVDTDDFYCLALSGNSPTNAARVVVRDYLEMPIASARQNLAAWFLDLRIIEPWGKELTTSFPLWQLALATAFDADTVAPYVPPLFMEAAIKCHPLPDSILANCLKRLSAEGGDGFRATRLGLIKLTLNRKGYSMSEELDPSRMTPAYVCGRLMAVFERIQWGALGDVNASIVDRFYGTASTSPGLVYPRLFKSAQQHLSKLQSEKPGMAVNLQKDVESLCGAIAKLPSILTLTEQGEFALGFYHQRAAFRRGRESNS